MKRTPLRPVSPKRRAENVVYAAFRESILERDDWRCRFWNFTKPEDEMDVSLPIACTPFLEVHHLASRKAFPAGLMEPTNVVTLCSRHHQHVTEHPAWAEARGLYIRAGVALADGEETL